MYSNFSWTIVANIFEYASDEKMYPIIMSLSSSYYRYFNYCNRLMKKTFYNRSVHKYKTYFLKYANKDIKYMVFDDKYICYKKKYHIDEGHLTIDLAKLKYNKQLYNKDPRIHYVYKRSKCFKRILSNGEKFIEEHIYVSYKGEIIDRYILMKDFPLKNIILVNNKGPRVIRNILAIILHDGKKWNILGITGTIYRKNVTQDIYVYLRSSHKYIIYDYDITQYIVSITTLLDKCGEDLILSIMKSYNVI